MKRILILFFMIGVLPCSMSQSKASWIWYPSDFEIWLGNEMQNRRTERNVTIPPFWRIYSHHPLVNFTREVVLEESETFSVKAEGIFNITIDSRYVQTELSSVTVPAGKHVINIQVINEVIPPSVYVSGVSIKSDKSWEVRIIRNNYPDNLPSNDPVVFADSWMFDSADNPPSKFKLPVKEIPSSSINRSTSNVLVDFGKESFGFVKFSNIKGKGNLHLYYGESREEAMSIDSCETLDHLIVDNESNYITPHSRAFRFVNVVSEDKISFDDVSLLYEYLPVDHSGKFTSSDELLNKIWNVSEYTLELTTREFFIDGIKRDRWIWSGDANQSYLMNYYSFNNNPVVKRTIRQLRGADPVEAHINTILDYSFYWFMSISDYYLYTGDRQFVKEIYPKMVSLMDYCLSRRNANGFVEGLPGDWVFLDWAPISKEGELSAIQMLLARSLESVALCASVAGDSEKQKEYEALSTSLRKKIFDAFWDKEKQCFIHSIKNGKADGIVTRYPNMFAMMFGYLDSTQIESVKNNALLNDDVLSITTPYMRFYELEALCAIGMQEYVTNEIKKYWGGMLDESATSFWEFYNPLEKGAQRYAMYNRPYGKSLCHAWGASPVYLLGRYYLGVKPTKPGYENFVIEPSLGGLTQIKGIVPTPSGAIEVEVTGNKMIIKSNGGNGVVKLRSAKPPSTSHGKVIKMGKYNYEIVLEPNRRHEISFKKV